MAHYERTAGDGWTKERDERLKALYADGCSASQIARELGDSVTRNAVIGRVHRLGIAGRRNASPPTTRKIGADGGTAFKVINRIRAVTKSATNSPAAVKDVPKPKRKPEVEIEDDDLVDGSVARDLPSDQSPFAVTLLDLQFDQCRWPLGEPGTPAFRYCGDSAAQILSGIKLQACPYCARHALFAYQPQPGTKIVPGKPRALPADQPITEPTIL